MADRARDTSWTISNVRVFDGRTLTGPRTVVVADGRIAADESGGGDVVDGAGGTLLPGLIDSHVHFDSADNLRALATWGVTTALDMGTQPRSLVDSLRGCPALPDIRSSASPASGPGSLQTTKGGFDPSTALTGPGEAARFVADRVAEGADYIKIIIENPAVSGPVALGGDTIEALVTAARDQGFTSFAHAASTAAYQLGIGAGVDVLTHAPLDASLTASLIQAMVSQGIRAVPTLTMMKGIAVAVKLPETGPGPGYRNAEASVGAMFAAGIPIAAGTDANNAPFVPFSPPHGQSLHGELELLVAAGLTPADALRSATVVPSQLFGLGDRGQIEPGLRADLLLVAGDPTADITATRSIQHVWIGGAQVR